MRYRVWFLTIACAAALAACKSVPTVPMLSSIPSNDAQASHETHAWGFVYSDPGGKALAGVPVAIAPWKPVDGKLQPSRTVARTDASGRFAFTAPSGKYLLTIGSDEAYTPPPGYHTPNPLTSVGDDPGLPGMNWRATLHDTIVLAGSTQHIKASLLPKQIIGRKAEGGFRYAAVSLIERTRNYRITALTSFEAECLAAEQLRRTILRRRALVPDEWLIENARAIHEAQVALNVVWDGFDWRPIGWPRKTPQSSTSGGSTCAFIVLGQYVKPQELSMATLWFGAAVGLGRAVSGSGARDTLQIEEWFIDPRRSSQGWPASKIGR